MREPMVLAVIGCGRFAKNFVPLFKAHPAVKKVCVCDLIPERAEWYSEKFGVEKLASGGWTPRPRKLSEDSTSMAPATPRVAETSTGARALGRICTKSRRADEAPASLEAAMKSRSRRIPWCRWMS